MRHLEPDQPAPIVRPAKQRSRAAAWLAAVFALTLVFGAGATWFLGPNSADHVAAREAQERQIAFTQVQPLRADVVPPTDTAKAIQSMRLEPAQQSSLQRLVQPDTTSTNPIATSSGLRLVNVTLWDTHAEDGDVVALVSAGYRREVAITNTPQTITIPVDGAAQVQLIGVRDGGGGITLGVRGVDQQVLMPIMSEGQTLVLPLAR